MFVLTRTCEYHDPPPDNAAPFGFMEAFRSMNEGIISWDEYIRHLLARIEGSEHQDDDIGGMHWKFLDAGPFRYSIYCWSKRIDNVEDCTPFVQVFDAYRYGPLQHVKLRIAASTFEHARHTRKSLAMLALQERRPDVLKFCLDEGGFPYEGYLEDEADLVDEVKDPETFRVLEESQLRQIYPRQPKGGDGNATEEVDDDGDSEPAAVVDKGGSHPVEW